MLVVSSTVLPRISFPFLRTAVRPTDVDSDYLCRLTSLRLLHGLFLEETNGHMFFSHLQTTNRSEITNSWKKGKNAASTWS